MRDLSADEVNSVNGGVVPLLAIAFAKGFVKGVGIAGAAIVAYEVATK